MCGKDVTRKFFFYVTTHKMLCCIAVKYRTARALLRAGCEDDDGTRALIQTILLASRLTEIPTRQLIQSAAIESATIRDVESV